MIGVPYRLEKKSNGLAVVFNDHTDPNNVIALQSYPSMDVEVRNEEIPREGQHGIWDFFSFYGKRLLIFEGVIIGANEAAVQTLKEDLQRVTALPIQPTVDDDGMVIVAWTDPLGRDLQVEAKLAAPIRFSRPLQHRYRLDFILTLKAPLPQIESQELLENDGLRGFRIGGIKLPTDSMGAVVLATNIINTIEVENAGNTFAETIIRLYGSPGRSITNPRVTNLTTGDFMQVNLTLTGPEQFVALNSRTGQVLDHNGADRSGDLEAGSEFIKLPPSTNQILYTSVESEGATGPVALRYSPDAVIEIEHRDTLI